MAAPLDQSYYNRKVLLVDKKGGAFVPFDGKREILHGGKTDEFIGHISVTSEKSQDNNVGTIHYVLFVENYTHQYTAFFTKCMNNLQKVFAQACKKGEDGKPSDFNPGSGSGMFDLKIEGSNSDFKTLLIGLASTPNEASSDAKYPDEKSIDAKTRKEKALKADQTALTLKLIPLIEQALILTKEQENASATQTLNSSKKEVLAPPSVANTSKESISREDVSVKDPSAQTEAPQTAFPS